MKLFLLCVFLVLITPIVYPALKRIMFPILDWIAESIQKVVSR